MREHPRKKQNNPNRRSSLYRRLKIQHHKNKRGPTRILNQSSKFKKQVQSFQMTHLLHTPTSPTKHQSLISQSHSPLHRETNRLGLNTPPTQSTLKTNHYTKIQQLFHRINTTPIHPMGRSATTAIATILNLPTLKNASQTPKPSQEKIPT